MKTQTINWSPFSEKHKRYIKNAMHNKMNVAEGAIRSGKTIDHCIIAAMHLEMCRDKIHLASGSTIANAKLNIGVCNGFGLENLFRGRCRWGKYKDNEALYINTQTGEKIVIFTGGGKADAYKRILGNSYGLWIATEINEHYDCEDSRSSFIKVAFGRQVAAKDPLVLWDLNPCNPNHTIYQDYIDAYLDGYKGGYQYEHFTLEDNLSISDERREEIISQYIPGSIWYRRDIQGERCIAEGLCFPNYEDALTDAIPDTPADEYYLSIDYGTLNPFAALLWERHGPTWYAVDELYYSGRETHIQKTDGDYLEMLNLFADKVIQENHRRVIQSLSGNLIIDKIRTIIDPSAASMITLLERSQNFIPIQADNAVEAGISDVNLAIQRGLIKVSRKCQNWIMEAGGYVWDMNCDTDRPVKDKDHLMDATRYFVRTLNLVNREYGYKSIFGGRR